jgi:hypothetical protein
LCSIFCIVDVPPAEVNFAEVSWLSLFEYLVEEFAWATPRSVELMSMI